MITFKELTKAPKNSLEIHFYGEFIISESLKYSFDTILEKYGSYIEQKDLILPLAKEIYKEIIDDSKENLFTINYKDLKDFKNIFFKKLKIEITTDDTGYIASKSKYDKVNRMFDEVFICINKNEYKTYNSIARCLMHEILHAWNNYESIVKKSKFSLQELTNKDSSYYKTIIGHNDIDIKSICKRILNNIRKWEQNAYLNELTIELDLNDFDCSEYKTANEAWRAAYNIFTNSDVWIQYSTLWTFLKNLKSNLTSNLQDEFAKEYNRINNAHQSFDSIYKKLDSQFSKIFLKIERVIPKIFNEYWQSQLNVDESFIFGRQSNTQIKFVQYINNYKIHKDLWS